MPLRRCAGCNEQKTKKELIRVVRTPEGNIILDKIHVCKSPKFMPHAQPSSGRGTQLIVENHTVEDDNDTYYHEFKEFIDCVQRGEESNINSPDRSIIVMKILDQVRSALNS